MKRTASSIGPNPAPLPQRRQLRSRGEKRRPRVQRNSDQLQANVFEYRVQVIDTVGQQPDRAPVSFPTTANRRVETQQQRIDAPGEVFLDRSLGPFQIGIGMFLTQLDARHRRAQRSRTTHERSHPGKAVRVVDRNVVRNVKRLEVDAFEGGSDKFFLERRPIQVGFHRRSPVLVIDRRELIANREFTAQHRGPLLTPTRGFIGC